MTINRKIFQSKPCYLYKDTSEFWQEFIDTRLYDEVLVTSFAVVLSIKGTYQLNFH